MGEDGGGGRGTKEKVWTETAEKKNILKVPKKTYPTTILCEPVNAGVCTSYFRKQMHMKPCLSTYQYTIKCNIKVNHKNMQ